MKSVWLSHFFVTQYYKRQKERREVVGRKEERREVNVKI